MSIEGQGHFFTINNIFQVLYVLSYSRPRYQVSVYRTIGPLVVKYQSGQRQINLIYKLARGIYINIYIRWNYLNWENQECRSSLC